MGGVIGFCTGHHSSLSDAIKLEVAGVVCDEHGNVRNIADHALAPRQTIGETAPLILIAGACMNSGKTYAATELIKQATRVGLRVAAGNLRRCLFARHVEHGRSQGGRHGQLPGCGLPSTVGSATWLRLPKAVIERLNESALISL